MNATLSETHSTAHPIIIAQRLLLSAALTLMILHFAVYVVYAANLIPFPFDYDQGEGFELQNVMLFASGDSPYKDNQQYPFFATNYPPFFHIMLIPLAKLFGAQYWYGRLVVFLGTLITAAAIGYAVRRETKHTPMAILSGLAFLASNYVYHIGPLFRQHMMMVMFETLAVVVLASLGSGRGRGQIVASLALLLIAGYTKQLAIATVAAVFIWLALRGVKRAVLYAIPFGLIAGGIFFLLNVLTNGEWWKAVITSNVNPYILGQYVGLARQFWGLHGALLIMAGLFFLYELYFDRLSLYSVWFAAGALNSVLSGKWGAGDSYFATWIASICLMAGIFTARFLQRDWRISPALSVQVARLLVRMRLGWTIGRTAQSLTAFFGVIACVLWVLYGLAVMKLPLDMPIFSQVAQVFNLTSNTKFPNFYDSAGWTLGYATIGQIPTAQDIANGWRIVEAVKADPRPSLSEEAAFSFYANKPIVSNPPQLLNFYQGDLYDSTNLINMVEDHAFGTVVLRRDPGVTEIVGFYPPPVMEAIKRAYQIDQAIVMNGFEYTILVPNPTWKR
ncbi:MAG: hypothetical protein OHK0023_16780 [Anaerolineae bacterium]